MSIKDFMDNIREGFEQMAEEAKSAASEGGSGADGDGGDGQAGGGDGVFTMDGKKVNQQRAQRPPRKPRGTPKSRAVVSLIITLIFGFVWYWFKLPAINPHEFDFWVMLFWMCVVLAGCMLFLRGSGEPIGNHPIKYFKSNVKVPFYIIVAICCVVLVGAISGMSLLRAHALSKLLPVENGTFAEEVEEVAWSQIPMLDADSANTLANRKLGELSDLVSQFSVNTNSSQINYQQAPVRVSYLDYGNIFKWLNNIRNGIPAYMIIDMRTQEVTVVRLDEGIKYCPSDYLIRDINRYLRFTHPFTLFDDINFEIDENGTPWWVASVIKCRVGLFGGRDCTGAVLVNAITGESITYDSLEDVPTWVDRVFSANLCMQQYNYYGTFLHGFWNSLFGQTDCKNTTSGYNYIVQGDDVYLYSGVTSISGDRGNLGFILINQRTKDAHYYSCAGADETSAMSSAEGAVQQYSYKATFPLLLNIDGQPTYFMALKDASSLVKMYAMVNVEQYQIVATGYSLQQCQSEYESKLAMNGISNTTTVSSTAVEDATVTSSGTISGKITEIRSATIDGNTQYFIKVEGSDSYFVISASSYPMAVILNVGDSVTITFAAGSSGSIIDGSGISLG